MQQCSVWKLGGRMLGRYIISCFLCLILVISLSMFSSALWSQLILLICSMGLTIGMFYQTAWDQGEHDCNYIDRGMMQEDKYRGLKAGLIASILPAVVWVIAMLSRAGAIPEGVFGFYRFLSTPFYVPISWLCGVMKEIPATDKTKAVTALVMMAAKDCAWWRVIVSLLPVAILPITGHLGYFFGRKRIVLWEKLIYKNGKKPPRNKKKRF